MMATTRWLFGDQLGDYFLDGPDQQVLLVESRAVFRRRRFHRQKAHLILSAMRHRAAELGERCTYLVTDTYREALAQVDAPLSVVQPTTWAALHLVDTLAGERDVERLPARGYVTGREEFTPLGAGAWAPPPAHGGLLPRRPDPQRRPDEGRRARPRPLELRRREPRATAEDGPARRRGPVVAGGGRDRRAGPRRPRPDGRGRDHVRRRGRPAALRRHAGRGAGGPRPLRRAPAGALRPLRGRDAGGRPLDGPLADLGPAEPRPARPARGRARPPRRRTSPATPRSRRSRASSAR